MVPGLNQRNVYCPSSLRQHDARDGPNSDGEEPERLPRDQLRDGRYWTPVGGKTSTIHLGFYSSHFIFEEELTKICILDYIFSWLVKIQAKLSCIAVAAASRGQLSYAHRPMDAAQHGANASKAEDFFGVGHAVPKLPYAVAYNAGTMMTRERSPLPFLGVCHETSWFDGGIRGPACEKAASGSEERRVVFQADNCFDEFYCGVIGNDQGGAAATWRNKVLPVLRGALFRTIDNRTLVSSQHPGILLVTAHARRGDAKTRGARGAHLQSVIRGLGRAWNGRVNVTIHTDGHTKEVLEEIGTNSEDGRINVHALGSGDGVSLEAACLDIIRADVFLASDSSLSRACGLYRDQDPSTVVYPSSAFLRPHLLARFGWTVAK